MNYLFVSESYSREISEIFLFFLILYAELLVRIESLINLKFSEKNLLNLFTPAADHALDFW